jgi:hypothetical protein
VDEQFGNREPHIEEVNWIEIAKNFPNRTSLAAKYKYERIASNCRGKRVCDKNSLLKCGKDVKANQPNNIQQGKKRISESNSLLECGKDVKTNQPNNKVSEEIVFLNDVANQSDSTSFLPNPSKQLNNIKTMLNDKVSFLLDSDKLKAIVILMMSATYLGCSVKQNFFGDDYIGKIVGYDGVNYTIAYDDGDLTLICSNEIEKYLCMFKKN